MGFFDFLTSTKKPAAGAPVLTVQEVRDRLLAVNRPTAPFRIVEGASEGVDLIAEWKIVEAQWYEIFARAGLSKVFRILLKFHAESNEVRALDKEFSVSWSAGVPTLKVAAESFTGQKQSIQFGTAYAFTETLEFGQVYNYHFDTREMKGPIQEAVTRCGWSYKGVVPPFSRL
jgi:hypothetical protein